MVRAVLLILSVGIIVARTVNSTPLVPLEQENRQYYLPTPYSDHNRIRVYILNYDLYHTESLLNLLNEFVSMCEGGWEVSPLLYTCANYTTHLRTQLLHKTFCSRTQSYLKVEIKQFDSEVGNWLSIHHRTMMKEDLFHFDYFVYVEDDMMFSYAQLMAHNAETKILASLVGDRAFDQYSIGFHRYRKRRDMHLKEKQLNGDNIIGEYADEQSELHPICIENQPYARVEPTEGGVHQAMSIITAQQAEMLQKRCNYFNIAHGWR